MIWIDVPGYEGEYKASPDGEILSLKKVPKKIKPLIDKFGYASVYLCLKGKAKRVKIHRIIASIFLDGFKPLVPVNHINGNKADNRAANLEMTTALKNMRHASMIGLRDHLKFESNPASVLTRKEVLEIRSLFKFGDNSKASLAKMYGVSHKTIRDILSNKTWVLNGL
jgi:hypothetical protein